MKTKQTKKSKPKQRTNWKQRALHCEEVIGVQNLAATSREKRADKLDKGMRYWADQAEFFRNERDSLVEQRKSLQVKLTAAEKRSALLLEEREATEGRHPAVKKLTRSEYDHFVASCNAEAKPSQKLIDLMKSPETLASLPSQLFYPGKELSEKYRAGLNPTHWQRFKSWLAEYGYELLGGAFVLAVLAGLGALLYWNR